MMTDPTWSPLPERGIEWPTRDERAAAIARLEAWACERGARYDAVAVQLDEHGDSTLRARRRIADGEPIVTIPRELIITGDKDELATWLPVEARRADSPWRPFLDVWPVAFPDIPMFRGGTDLDALAGTWVRRVAAEVHEGILASYAALAADVRAGVSLADYAWARAVMSSRGFNAAYAGANAVGFVPIVDLMNHRNDDSRAHYDPAREEYAIIAGRTFAPGEEVMFDYGAKSNWRLFLHYGFALEHNAHDTNGLIVAGTSVFHAGFDEPLLGPCESPDALADVARDALVRLERHATPDTGSWWHTGCARVRRGERLVLEDVLATLAKFSGHGTSGEAG